MAQSSRRNDNCLSFVHIGSSAKHKTTPCSKFLTGSQATSRLHTASSQVTSSQVASSQVPAPWVVSHHRPRRLIIEEESEDEEDLFHSLTPPSYSDHERDIDNPAGLPLRFSSSLIPSSSQNPGSGSNESVNSEKPKMTSLYSQLDFIDDDLERELDLKFEYELEDEVESCVERYEHDAAYQTTHIDLCRKRKRNTPPSYTMATEDTIQRLINYWVLHACSVTEAAKAVYMNPRTAWRYIDLYKETGKFPSKKRRGLPKLSKEHCEFMEEYLDENPLSTL
ncbi:hypothetical protein FBU30_002288 [Linnemannia zychae]|nr:hypothetical protein FBU30_002288 [Linnemannia zychae]